MGTAKSARLRPAPPPVQERDGGTGDLVARVRDTLADSGWTLSTDGALWCTAVPGGVALPAQGWKIHVSARTADGADVLDRVCAVLVPRRVPFKFARDTGRLRMLNSREADRASCGKFVTVYPADDAAFVEVVRELDDSLRQFAGPLILTDRPCRPGSVVQYRYGGFTHRAVLGNDGAYRASITAPDGSVVEDSRQAWFAPPSWAVDPWRAAQESSSSPADVPATAPAAAAAATPRASGQGVVIGGRFRVTSALRHSAKGGVYLGIDITSGDEVVVKQARAHVETDRTGRDARAAARHESELLVRLASTGLTPRHVAFVEAEDASFLAQERVPGVPLRTWVMRNTGAGRPDVPWQDAEPVVAELIRLVSAMHRHGLVIRDLSPTNVIVGDDLSLRLVDLELAADDGTVVGRAGTPGYRAPEQDDDPDGYAAAYATDLFSLGGLLFLLVTGMDPALPEDGRCPLERVGGWLDLAERQGGDTAVRLAPAVRGLLHRDPALRWTLDDVRAWQAWHDAEGSTIGCGHASCTRPRAAGARPRGARDASLTTAPEPAQVLTDGLAHLVATMQPGHRDHLWPMTAGAAAMDPCAVQYGAAGVLGVLARAARTPAPGTRDVLLDAVRTTADWLRTRAEAESVVLPGLHFGRSGTAWALLDAAELLGDRELADAATEWALRVPVQWPNPDVCHGAAGAGLTQLRLWHATGDERFLRRVTACADGLLAEARTHDGLVLWPVARDFDSALAGAVHLGFAHGVAGIGTFLLGAALATHHDGYLGAAVAAGRTLARTARPENGAAWWPQGPADPPGVRLAHWCSGASGAGTFLVRLSAATGDPVLAELAERAGVAAHRARWHSGTAACHGLAGNGEFLLDIADLTGRQEYRAYAADCADLIAARCATVDGRLVPSDETAVGTSASYGAGLAGVLGFLLRLRDAGPRMWTDAALGTPHAHAPLHAAASATKESA